MSGQDACLLHVGAQRQDQFPSRRSGETDAHGRRLSDGEDRRAHSLGKPRTLAASRAGGRRGALPPLLAGVRAAGAWLPDCQHQNQERVSLSSWAARCVATCDHSHSKRQCSADGRCGVCQGRAPGWQRTCLAFLKPLEEAQLLAQDLPEQPGHEQHGPGPAGPARVHQRVGHQGDAALGPEAAGGGACGGQRQGQWQAAGPRPSALLGGSPGGTVLCPSTALAPTGIRDTPGPARGPRVPTALAGGSLRSRSPVVPCDLWFDRCSLGPQSAGRTEDAGSRPPERPSALSVAGLPHSPMPPSPGSTPAELTGPQPRLPHLPACWGPTGRHQRMHTVGWLWSCPH